LQTQPKFLQIKRLQNKQNPHKSNNSMFLKSIKIEIPDS